MAEIGHAFYINLLFFNILLSLPQFSFACSAVCLEKDSSKKTDDREEFTVTPIKGVSDG